MKHLIFVGLGLILILLPFSISAQQLSTDTVFQLKEFTLQEKRAQKFASGLKTETTDSLLLMSSKPGTLDELLQRQSRAIIKSYGPGNLATSSLRGAGANHTAIIWNGFNLQSPTNGTFDLALMPVEFIDDASVQLGSSSNLWGSGAIGGAINLNNKPEANQGFSIRSSSIAGSFGEKQQFTGLSYSNTKFSSSLKTFIKEAENEFSYVNSSLEGNPLVRQTNNKIKQKGLIQENYLYFKNGQQLKTVLWLQQSVREIPPVMSQASSEAIQGDDAIRLTTEYAKKGRNFQFFLRQAVFQEDVYYDDATASIAAKTTFQTSITEAEITKDFKRATSVNFGINHTYSRSESTGYEEIHSLSRPAVFASIKKTGRKENWNITLSGRQEFADNAIATFAPFAGFEAKIKKDFTFKSSVSKSYRLPTLNDLYWNPGGNPNLLPETGWSQEAGIHYSKNLKSFSISAEATAYNRVVDNWIIWLPQNNYWTPQNLMKVWSRGTETGIKAGYQLKKIRIQWDLMTSYTRSTNEKAKSANDASIGKQLIYVPMYSGNSNLSIIFNQYVLVYSYSYSGYRYTSSDNIEYLEPFQLSSLYFSRSITAKNFKFNGFARINNLLNEHYQVMAQRPMPGRNYQIGVSINYHKL
ncbi:MAG: TonB-dependent receptor [Bacteroidetes bacterium]|nr:TonB-dependent receptor [Bacteroidota bacterium]